jgi:hypothetical protein
MNSQNVCYRRELNKRVMTAFSNALSGGVAGGSPGIGEPKM